MEFSSNLGLPSSMMQVKSSLPINVQTSPQPQTAPPMDKTNKDISSQTLMIGATVLASLTALLILGRKGKLGEPVQKFLGGVKNESSNIVNKESSNVVKNESSNIVSKESSNVVKNESSNVIKNESNKAADEIKNQTTVKTETSTNAVKAAASTEIKAAEEWVEANKLVEKAQELKYSFYPPAPLEYPKDMQLVYDFSKAKAMPSGSKLLRIEDDVKNTITEVWSVPHSDQAEIITVLDAKTKNVIRKVFLKDNHIDYLKEYFLDGMPKKTTWFDAKGVATSIEDYDVIRGTLSHTANYSNGKIEEICFYSPEKILKSILYDADGTATISIHNNKGIDEYRYDTVKKKLLSATEGNKKMTFKDNKLEKLYDSGSKETKQFDSKGQIISN